MNFHRLRWVVCALALAALLVGVVGVAVAVDLPPVPAQHGISLTKGCESPTQVGQPYTCTLLVPQPHGRRPRHDDGQRTHQSSTPKSGDVSSGNVFGSLQAGDRRFLARVLDTADLPWRPGRRQSWESVPWAWPDVVHVPFGSRLNVLPFSFYTVQAGRLRSQRSRPRRLRSADVARPLRRYGVPGTGAGSGNCNPNPPVVPPASQTTVTQLTSDDHRHPQGQRRTPVPAVEAGSTVHDFVSVSGGRAILHRPGT